jgi:hypothetical protein
MLMTPPPYYSPSSMNRQSIAGPLGGAQTSPGPQSLNVTKPGLPGLSGIPQIGGTQGSNPFGSMKMPGVGQPGMPGGGMPGMGTNPMNMANILRR